MKMNKFTLSDNNTRWIFVIAFIVLPIVLVRVLEPEYLIRLFCTTLLVTLLPTFLFIRLFHKDSSIFSSSKKLRDKYKQKTLKKWDWVFRIIVLITLTGALLYVTVPILRGSFEYLVIREPLREIVATIVEQEGGQGGSFIIGWSLSLSAPELPKENNFSFWYPNNIRVGEKYRFLILPNENIILKAEKF